MIDLIPSVFMSETARKHPYFKGLGHDFGAVNLVKFYSAIIDAYFEREENKNIDVMKNLYITAKEIN